jgi:ketosteroid isomerase-like protein
VTIEGAAFDASPLGEGAQRRAGRADGSVHVSATSSAVSSARTDDLALVIGVWSFNGTGLDGQPVQLAARNADVLRRQSDGTWRFVIDNPWGAD